MKRSHAMPFGAECREDGSVRFRLWAPKAERVDLSLWRQGVVAALPEETLPLSRLDQGWFELVTDKARAGTHYQFQIAGEMKVPDPASRFQPLDVHGPSEVLDPRSFEWNDEYWQGRPWEEAVIYELHVGTFTPEGTFAAVERKLDYLADLGITALELMPVADFPGRRNWGYDGVLPYAPDNVYGRPEDLKRLIQAAHAKGLMIFLDVVYNHFGPEGNYLRAYSPEFFTSRHQTPWGEAINFDGPGGRVVRDFFIHNAMFWLEEYHLDGLRLDAVHAIADESTPDIITELAETVRSRFEDRHIHLILENEANAAHYLKRKCGRSRCYEAQWNDDIHHALHVLLTGESDGYYADYSAQPVQMLRRCLGEGFAFQGDYSNYHRRNRGECSRDLPPSAFVSFLQNHDQIGNRAFGERILKLTHSKALKAAMEILLLAPAPPLLFMGEEFGATTPFLFFCNFEGELAAAVTNGRRSEFARFQRFSSPEMRAGIPDPNAEETFLHSKLDWETLNDSAHATWLKVYHELLGLRRKEIVPRLSGISGDAGVFSVLQSSGLFVQWKLGDGAVLKLLANLGDKTLTGVPRLVGEMIYESNKDLVTALEQKELPPWSVAWFIET